MLFYTAGQSRVFLMMLYVGLGVGAWCTLLDALRRLQQAGALRSLWLDLLGGAGAAGLIVWGSLRVCEGELRVYALLGGVCGCLLFVRAVYPPARRLMRAVRRLAHRARDGNHFLKKNFR